MKAGKQEQGEKKRKVTRGHREVTEGNESGRAVADGSCAELWKEVQGLRWSEWARNTHQRQAKPDLSGTRKLRDH